jgi:hypothetical protein
VLIILAALLPYIDEGGVMPSHATLKANVEGGTVSGSTEEQATEQITNCHLLAEEPETDQGTKSQLVLAARKLALNRGNGQAARDEAMRLSVSAGRKA